MYTSFPEYAVVAESTFLDRNYISQNHVHLGEAHMSTDGM